MVGVIFITPGVNFLAANREAVLLHQKQCRQNDKDEGRDYGSSIVDIDNGLDLFIIFSFRV